MRVTTEGKLVVYLQSAKNSHKIISRDSQISFCQAEVETQSPDRILSNTIAKYLLSKAARHGAGLPNMVAVSVKDTADFKGLRKEKKPTMSLMIIFFTLITLPNW